MTQDSKYKTDYEKLSFYSIGGLWGYAVMLIRDANGVLKVRLAKCKRKGGFPATEREQWEEVDPVEIENLSQVNKINFKTPEEFEACYTTVLASFEEVSEEE